MTLLHANRLTFLQKNFLLDLLNPTEYNILMANDLLPSPEFSPVSPEIVELVNTYIETMDLQQTAIRMDLPLSEVTQLIQKPECQRYITEIFLNSGYRNRFKLGAALDKIIEKKLQELEEADISSSKDILDILALAHKFRMDEIAALTKLEEVRNGKPKRQTNIQINQNSSDNPLGKLFSKLTDAEEI